MSNILATIGAHLWVWVPELVTFFANQRLATVKEMEKNSCVIKPILIPILLILLTSCARGPLTDIHQAMRPTKKEVKIGDDLHLKSFVQALTESLRRMAAQPDKVMTFGPRKITQAEYSLALQGILKAIEVAKSKAEVLDYIGNNFQLYEVYGKKEWGEVFVTSYYDPVIKGSRYKTKEFTQPLYKTPKDMVQIDIGAFADRFPKWKLFADEVLEQKSRKAIVRGRLDEEPKIPQVVPYYDRREIDSGKVLENKRLELAYVDPIDAFFMQIQGSGTVSLKNGKDLRLGYDSQNGHPYVAIGKFLLDQIPLEEMSMQRIQDHLSKMDTAERQSLMNENPSYVFFQKLKGPSQTFYQTDVVAGRTIATDYGVFPKGAMVLIEFPKPQFKDEEALEPEEFMTTKRLVFDHDTGGAIRGPARLDLYWGKGKLAQQHAGVMRHWGKMFYLFPKSL